MLMNIICSVRARARTINVCVCVEASYHVCLSVEVRERVGRRVVELFERLRLPVKLVCFGNYGYK